MPQLLRCANGHEWEAPVRDVVSDAISPCPVCGLLARTLPPAPTIDLASTGPAPAAGDAAPGTPAVTGYEILGELGRGGMGIVYQARDRARDRLVALKVIRKERLTHPEMVRRFRREAQAAARLSHPNIVVVYEADQVGDTHYLAMEYVPGVT